MKSTKTSWFFIINPKSGNGSSSQRWSELEKLLQAENIPYQYSFTETIGHAIHLAKAAVEKGFRKIVAVGGDGTGHEVVNGILMQETCPSTEISFFLYPVGTGNDWVKMYGIPKKMKKWIAILKQENHRFQEVGLIKYHQEGKPTQRYFYNVAGLAYDGYLGKMTAMNRPEGSGKLHYIWLIVKCLFQYKLKKAKVIFGNQIIRNSFYTINIGVCKFSGGGMQAVPHADPDDGKLALTIATKTSKLSVLLATPLFYLGKIFWHPVVSIFQIDHLKVESEDDSEVLIEADGEFLGETPVEISVLKEALKIIVP